MQYAKAFADIAIAQGAPQTAVKQLADFGDAFTESAELRNFLGSPAVDTKAKHRVIEKILAQQGAGRIVRNFLFVILDHHRSHMLPEIIAAVQEVVEADGFSVVRDFVGHGIGNRMHEDPQVPNYGQRGMGTKLRAGMVLAIEPMVNVGKPGVQVLSDGWTAVTEDGSLSAHFEHTVAVTAEGPRILTKARASLLR